MDALAVNLGAMGLGVANAAKHKLVGMLSHRLKSEAGFVGEVMLAGPVKGTPTGVGAGIEGSTIAHRFWDLYRARGAMRARVA
jgi:hypothetical protein